MINTGHYDELPTAQLDAELRRMLEDLAARMEEAATLFIVLDKRGHPMPYISRELAAAFRDIAYGSLCKEAALNFSRDRGVATLVSSLPMPEQKRLALGQVQVVTALASDGTPFLEPSSQGSYATLSRAIFNGKILSVREQVARFSAHPKATSAPRREIAALVTEDEYATLRHLADERQVTVSELLHDIVVDFIETSEAVEATA